MAWKKEYSKFKTVDSRVNQQIYVPEPLVQRAKCYDADNCVIAKVFQGQLGYDHATVYVTRTYVYDEETRTRTVFVHGPKLQSVIREFDTTRKFPKGRYILSKVPPAHREKKLKAYRKRYAEKVKLGKHIPKNRPNRKTTIHVRSLNR